MSRTGRFVVLEGGDASGKTTQVALLVKRLQAEGHDVVETFEPGATSLGRAIRAVLLDGDEMEPLAETLLLAADRAQHVREVVIPSLQAGKVVVSDRFLPSSLAYQGVGRNVGVGTVERINVAARGGVEPHIVVVLDVPDDVAASRHDPGDRLERAGADFHRRVRAAYRDLAPARGWVVVDGTGDIESIAEGVWAAVRDCVQT